MAKKQLEGLMDALKPIAERKNMFVELFSETKRKPKGPVWHLWHFFLALTPSLFLTAVCTNVKPADEASKKARLDRIQNAKAEMKEKH